MSTTKIKLKIATPEKPILEEEVEQVTLPTQEGQITILPGHAPLIASLGVGDIVASSHNKEEIPVAIARGFVEVRPAVNGISEVIILADFAEHVEHLTDDYVAKARARAHELEEKMRHESDVDFEHFESELERSIMIAKIADKWKSKKYRK